MNEFITTQEAAKAWGVPAHHIESLCAQGKILGAEKRGDIWLIPFRQEAGGDDSSYLRFEGTKQSVLEKAAELFALRSYELVSMKDISSEVGIRASSIYYYFKSKQEILDTLYDFFIHYAAADRPTMEELEPVLREGSLTEIIRCTYYNYSIYYEKLLLSINQIIYQREFIDERAERIYLANIDGGILFIEQVLNRAVEIGRLAPFDTHSFAVYIMASRNFFYYRLMPNYSKERNDALEDELENMNRLMVGALTDLKAT